jgi:hypothetical protein
MRKGTTIKGCGQILIIRGGSELIPSLASQSTSIGAANELCLALTLQNR